MRANLDSFVRSWICLDEGQHNFVIFQRNSRRKWIKLIFWSGPLYFVAHFCGSISRSRGCKISWSRHSDVKISLKNSHTLTVNFNFSRAFRCNSQIFMLYLICFIFHPLSYDICSEYFVAYLIRFREYVCYYAECFLVYDRCKFPAGNRFLARFFSFSLAFISQSLWERFLRKFISSLSMANSIQLSFEFSQLVCASVSIFFRSLNSRCGKIPPVR